MKTLFIVLLGKFVDLSKYKKKELLLAPTARAGCDSCIFILKSWYSVPELAICAKLPLFLLAGVETAISS